MTTTNTACQHLIIQVIVALVHLLQSEAPLVLHVDVRVELPLCSLHKLTNRTASQPNYFLLNDSRNATNSSSIYHHSFSGFYQFIKGEVEVQNIYVPIYFIYYRLLQLFVAFYVCLFTNALIIHTGEQFLPLERLCCPRLETEAGLPSSVLT